MPKTIKRVKFRNGGRIDDTAKKEARRDQKAVVRQFRAWRQKYRRLSLSPANHKDLI